MNGNKNRSTFADSRRVRVLQIAPRCNGPFRSEVRARPGRRERAVDRHRALSVRICAAYAITERRRDREKEGYARGEGRTGVLRPPKVKSRDGEGPSGDRALRDAKSKREVKHMNAAPLTRDPANESPVSLKQSM